MEILDITNNCSSAWIDKFRPQKINEVIGNNKAIYQIVQWLKNFDKNKKEYFEKICKLKSSKKTEKKEKNC